MKPDFRSKKVLITGINGFTGIYLEDSLASRLLRLEQKMDLNLV